MGQFEGCAKAPPEVEPSVLQTDGEFIVFLIFDPSGLIKVPHATQLDESRCKPLIYKVKSVDFEPFRHNIKYLYVFKNL